MSGSTSSGAQPARRGKCSNGPLVNWASHNRNFTSKAVMCVCMSVTRMYLPCSFTLRAFRCVVMSASRAGERAIAGRRTDQHREDSSDKERWRSPSAGCTYGTSWLFDSASELRKSKANCRTARRPRQPVPGTGSDSSSGRGWSWRHSPQQTWCHRGWQTWRTEPYLISDRRNLQSVCRGSMMPVRLT